MSIFDPLGLLSHFLVHGRIIVQDIWRTQAGWDQEIVGDILGKWSRWIAQFNKLERVRINRPYFPGFSTSEIGPLQLHVFVDASEEAYACVAYFRAEIKNQVHCALVMAKSKVAPLKALSIPRLELQGALLGARMKNPSSVRHCGPTRKLFWRGLHQITVDTDSLSPSE
ncbi:uncharacterized protein LOC129766570 [Toxorhynchites rutilus septentrionalis]|uniref:uncharacterized protein LOC129766570 n=1 Tax=Toxorhynchites rutilus septentrionalis TaxID=329112 RepID=UPI00247864EA|nr:uncharacterized protein LOC129766570 [Toxorhynchites rutilus septentrionalis]